MGRGWCLECELEDFEAGMVSGEFEDPQDAHD